MKAPWKRIAVGLLGLIVVWLLYGRVFAGDVSQEATSPDGRMIAQVRGYQGSGATEATRTTVEIRKRFYPFRHTILIGRNEGTEPRIEMKVRTEWRGAETLRIVLPPDFVVEGEIEKNWNGVRIETVKLII